MYNDSTWRGPVIWASEPRMSLVSTCAGYSSPLLFVFFFSWSIYHKLHKLSQWGDRRPVQAFFWNRQASQESHCCSGHVCWSTALQQLHVASLPSPLQHPPPPCEEPSLTHSPPNCFFSLARAPGKPGRSQDFIGCFREVPPQYWLGPENPAGSPSATQVVTRLKRTSEPTPSACYQLPPHINSSFMSCVWGILCPVFGDFICIRGQKAALWPQGFIQAPLGGDGLTALHCWVNYTSICLGLIYGYLWLCSKSKWPHWRSGFLTSLCLLLFLTEVTKVEFIVRYVDIGRFGGTHKRCQWVRWEASIKC